MKEILNPIPTLFTIRLSQEEADYVNENLYLIRGDEVNMTRSKVFMNALTKAVSNVKPKEIIKDNPELLNEIEQLKQEKAQLIEANSKLQEDLNLLLEEKRNAIILNLKESFKNYFWGMLEISKRDGFASSYEELFEKMLKVFQARGEFILDQKDIEYLKILKQKENE